MNPARFACAFLALRAAMALAATPLPIVYQPLVPSSVQPGHTAFTLTVRGSQFVAGAVAHWNGSARKTTFISSSEVQASITAADVAKTSTASVTVVNPGGHRSNGVFFQVRIPASKVSFALDGNVQIPGGVAIADFNGDGHADIAVGLNSSTLEVFPGKGSSQFGTAVSTSTNLPGNFLMTADFNNDGKPDLAVISVNGGLPIGSIYLGNGDGSFKFPATAGFGGQPYALGDINADGKLDMATITNNAFNYNSVTLLYGKGDGTFRTSAALNATGVPEGGVTVGDFNGDGKLDLALPAFTSNNVLQVYPGNGNGTFQAPLDSPISQSFAAVVPADVNGDGILDLVADGKCVFLGKGDGSFTEKGCIAIPSGLFVVSMVFGDFNGDGKLDLLSLGSFATPPFNQLVLLSLGNGDGTFDPPMKISAGKLGASPELTGLAIGDFNNDGKMDFAVSSLNRTFVYLQK
jgi:hypothetical protein